MKTFLGIIALFLITTSCHTYHNSDAIRKRYKDRSKEEDFTVVIWHEECTDCLGGLMLKGKIPVPQDLRYALGDTLQDGDLILVGNFPHDLIVPGGLFNNSKWNFKIVGKLIGIDTFNLNQHNAPIFYVKKWKKIKSEK